MLQKVMLIGNLGNDPEMRYMPDGTAVSNFSLATNKRWTNQQTGEPVEQTTWWRISVWGKQAESVTEYLEKGRQVYIEGEMKPDPKTGGPRTFTRQDGTVGSAYDIRAFNVRFLQGSKESAAGGGQTYDSNVGEAVATEEDEIPF